MSEHLDVESLRYPIGKLNIPRDISKEQMNQWIEDIKSFPENVNELVQNLPEEQLNWRYRPNGWTIKQVIHHTADSHMNAFIRFKLALTEQSPSIKPYAEDQWAELPDTREVHITASLSILQGLHTRWTKLLNSMSSADFQRKLYHPEHERELTLEFMLGLYAWHCRHHTAHIKKALETKGQYS